MQAVSKTSKNPARVMRFLNLLNTDPYVKNLIFHGVEGKHYNKVDGNTVETIAGSGYSLYANTWAIGNVFLDYILSTEDPTKHEQLRAYNDRAIDSMVNTFLPAEITEPKRKQRQMEIKEHNKQL